MLKLMTVATNSEGRRNEGRGTGRISAGSKRGMNGRYMYSSRSCPQCGDGLMRVHRRVVDRLYSLYRPVHRYQCTSLECGWQGNLPQRTVLAREGLAPLTTPTGTG